MPAERLTRVAINLQRMAESIKGQTFVELYDRVGRWGKVAPLALFFCLSCISSPGCNNCSVKMTDSTQEFE